MKESLVNKWESESIGNVCKLIRGPFGGSLKKSVFVENGTPVLEQQHAIYGDFSNIRYFVNPTKYQEMKRFTAEPGDLIMSCSGTLGKVAIVPDFIGPSIINQALLLIKPSKKLLSTYLYYAMQSNQFNKSLMSNTLGTAIKNVASVATLKELIIPVPPIEEQKRIVSILADVFKDAERAKEIAEKNLVNMESFFATYLDSIFQNKTVGNSVMLKDIAEYKIGLTYSPKDVSSKGIVVLRSTNIQKDQIVLDDLVRVSVNVKPELIVQPGDILMCSRNGSKRLVGKTATIGKYNEPMTFGTFMTVIRSKYNSYLEWFFKSNSFRNQINGGSNPMINQVTKYMLDAVTLHIPDMEQQKTIIKEIEQLYADTIVLEEEYKKKSNNLSKLKKSVLNKAFRGEL